MTGKEMLQELIGQLSKVDPGPINISDKEEEIMDSVINCIPVYMPYASALLTIEPSQIVLRLFQNIQQTLPLLENLSNNLIK